MRNLGPPNLKFSFSGGSATCYSRSIHVGPPVLTFSFSSGYVTVLFSFCACGSTKLSKCTLFNILTEYSFSSQIGSSYFLSFTCGSPQGELHYPSSHVSPEHCEKCGFTTFNQNLIFSGGCGSTTQSNCTSIASLSKTFCMLK